MELFLQTVDHMIQAYRMGSFAKILEFMKLRDRLAASQHYKAVQIDRILLDLLTEVSQHEQTVKLVSYLVNQRKYILLAD